MSIMTKIFGQNAQGQNILELSIKRYVDTLTNENFELDGNSPPGSLFPLIVGCVTAGFIGGAVGFVGTLIGANIYQADNPLQIAIHYGLSAGVALPIVAIFGLPALSAPFEAYEKIKEHQENLPQSDKNKPPEAPKP